MTGTLASIIQSFTRLFQWWITVVPWEKAVRIRLGKRVALLGPGVHLAIPYVDELFVQSTRRRWVSLHNRTLTTADGKVLVVGAVLGYEIEDVLLLYQTLHHAEATLQNEAAAAIAQYVATHTLDECQPMTIGAQATAVLDFQRYGLDNVALRIDEYCLVPRTYRIVSGIGDRYGVGKSLDTTLSRGSLG